MHQYVEEISTVWMPQKSMMFAWIIFSQYKEDTYEYLPTQLNGFAASLALHLFCGAGQV